MSSQPRRILTPSASRKRKDMEAFAAVEPAPPPPLLSQAASCAVSAIRAPDSKPAEPISSNLLLAGYMAQEYLTKGTLFGQRWDPGRAEAVSLSASNSGESKKTRLRSHVHGRGWEPEPEASPKIAPAPVQAKAKPHQSYAEVARLLKSDGVHIPGIVNPMQLARWIQM